MSTVNLKSLTMRQSNGRLVVFCNVVDSAGSILINAQIGSCLSFCKSNNLTIANHAEVLDTLIMKLGFAS